MPEDKKASPKDIKREEKKKDKIEKKIFCRNSCFPKTRVAAICFCAFNMCCLMPHNTANMSLKRPADSTGGVILNFPNAVLPFPQ